jgi:hypothetical protein
VKTETRELQRAIHKVHSRILDQLQELFFCLMEAQKEKNPKARRFQWHPASYCKPQEHNQQDFSRVPRGMLDSGYVYLVEIEGVDIKLSRQSVAHGVDYDEFLKPLITGQLQANTEDHYDLDGMFTVCLALFFWLLCALFLYSFLVLLIHCLFLL